MQLPRRFADTLRGLLEASRERLGGLRPEPAGPTRESLASLLGIPAEPPDDEDETETQLLLAQATIDELRTALERLQPLGEQLGEVERARLDLLDELEQLRQEPRPPETADELRHELERARKELTKRDRRIATLEERLARMRGRYEERHRTAADRWRELQELRRRLRDLEGPAPSE